MTISARGRYALRLMIDLAQHAEAGWVSLKEISARQDISAKYLEQIVTPLTKAGFLKALRGAQGGYRLAKPPREITAWDILDTVGGPLAPVKCLQDPGVVCARAAQCQTVDFWRGLDKVMRDYLTDATLQDFVDKTRTVSDYSI